MLWRQFEFLYCILVWGPQVGGHLGCGQGIFCGISHFATCLSMSWFLRVMCKLNKMLSYRRETTLQGAL